MSIENILYNIGYGLPFVLVLGSVSGLGWRLRREIGLVFGGGITAAIFSFGTIIKEAGESVTQRQSTIAAGASVFSAVAAFSIVYAIAKEAQGEMTKYPKFGVATGMLALTVAGSLGAMIATLLLTGHSWMSGYTESLMIYVLLLGGLTYAAAEWNSEKSTNKDMTSPNP